MPMHYRTAYSEAKVKGSPDFTYNAGALNASASTTIGFELTNDISGENRFGYAPFNNLTVFNNSSQVIRVEINQDTANRYTVPANANLPIVFNGGINSVRLTNVGSGSVTSGDLLIAVSNSGVDSDTLSKRIGAWLFRG